MTSDPPGGFPCSQCGGALEPAEGQVFLACPYCGSTVFLDRSRVVFHWAVACTVDGEAARAALFRWMAGNRTVKDLDQKSRVLEQRFQYFPLWYLKTASEAQESVALQPAAALSVTELKELTLPAGDLRPYPSSLDAQAVRPEVPLEAAFAWLAEQGVAESQVLERALVHVPVHAFRYEFEGQAYSALVDGAAGRVFVNLFPKKAEAPYRALGCLACFVYFLLAWIPVLGYLIGEGQGLAVGILVYALAATLAAVPLFMAGAWISARV